MTLSGTRRRLAVAGIMAAAALGTAGGAQAAPSPERCEQKLETIETRFRVIEERRGYEAAVEWWDGAWRRYHDRCVI